MMINISGTEGVGKTLASGIIQETLKDMGVKFAKTREPGGTPIAEEIRRLLKDFMSEETFHPMTELLLFYGARYQLFQNLILPELKQGSVIISDRSYACTFAYQVRASGVISEDDFWTVHNLVMKDMPTYDLIFHLFTDTVEEGLQRARGRGELDRIESNHIEFFRRADEGYREFFRDNPSVVPINTSTNCPNAVRKIIEKELKARVFQK
jgi:dTMP kinase